MIILKNKKLQELDCEIDEQTIRDKVKFFRLNWKCKI